MTGPVLTSKATAEYYGIAVQTLYNLISQGQGPKHYKQGSGTRSTRQTWTTGTRHGSLSQSRESRRWCLTGKTVHYAFPHAVFTRELAAYYIGGSLSDVDLLRAGGY